MIDEIILCFLFGLLVGFVLPCCYILLKTIKELENKILALHQKLDQNAENSIVDAKQLITEIEKSTDNKQ